MKSPLRILRRDHFLTFTGALIAAAWASAASAAVITVTDPAGTQGTNVNTAGRTILASYGNLSMGSLNADPGQFTLPFDQAAFTNGDTLDKVVYTAGSDFGSALTVDFTAPSTNWWLVNDDARPAKTTSASKGLSLRQITYSGSAVYFTLSQSMGEVGFTLNDILLNDQFVVTFYSDAAGANALYTTPAMSGSGSANAGGAHLFVGYENYASGIQRVGISFNVVDSNSTGVRQLDDLSFVVVPEPRTGLLLLLSFTGIGVLALRRSSHPHRG